MTDTLLKKLILNTGNSQAFVAKQLGISAPTLSLLINQGRWPRRDAQTFRARLRDFLKERGADDADIKAAFADLDGNDNSTNKQEEILMIRKQSLTPQARRKFRIPREIFSDEFSEAGDIFYSPETRYVSECLYQLAKHGGWLALIGDSGSGKTTLFTALDDRLAAEGFKIRVIQPYVLGMDNGNKKAVAMKPTHICESILEALNVDYKGNLSPESLFRLTHEKLKDSATAGFRHLLVIEEAHSLPRAMFKALKRFYELKKGVTRLLSILLLGQDELKHKLAEDSKDVREAVQRMELVELGPMDDLEGYVRHRCKCAGANFDTIFDPDALPELALRMVGPRDKRSRAKSLLYPLLVGNTLTKAINKAEDLKMERVNAAIIQTAIQNA